MHVGFLFVCGEKCVEAGGRGAAAAVKHCSKMDGKTGRRVCMLCAKGSVACGGAGETQPRSAPPKDRGGLCRAL